MKKKLAAFMLVLAAASGTTALADGSITAHTEDNSVVFTKQAWMDEKVVLACYDTAGILKYANIYTSENDGFKVTLPEEYARMRAFFMESGEICEVEISDEPLATAVPTAAPQVTAEPTAEPTATPQATEAPNNTYPEIYKSSVAAKGAFAVVEKVSSAVKDGDDIYKIDVLFQGEEKTIDVDANLPITTASDYFSYMRDQSMASLKKGDVIYFAYNLSKTKIKTLDFIYRPLDEEIALSTVDYGEYFEKLISHNGYVASRAAWGVDGFSAARNAEYKYAFGIITDKSGLTMTLYPKSGLADGMKEIDLDKNTIVYRCKMSEKNKLEIIHQGGISKTVIPKNAYDDDDNIVFTSDYTYNYALVRMVDGVATDIIVYEN